MKTWIVTGGAASGKSTFCRLLQARVPGSHLFSSDEEVHKQLARQPVKEELVAGFGPGVLDSNGEVSRPFLRAVVFADLQARARLEGLLHPLVREAFSAVKEELLSGRKAQLLIAEVPLFYESPVVFAADQVIVVATGPDVQQERLTGPRGLDAETASRIRSVQWPLSRKLDPADKVVWNEGSPRMLELQADLLASQFHP